VGTHARQLPVFIHRFIRNVSVLITVRVSQVLFTNTIFGVIVLTEECPAFFLMPREDMAEISSCIPV